MTQLVGLCIDLFIHYYYRFKAGFFVIYSRYQLKSGNFLQRNKKKNLVLSTEPFITIGYVLNI